MLVERSSWHSRIYLWWYADKYGPPVFHTSRYDFDRSYWENRPKNTNLCPYMRAVMFWSWLRFLLIPKPGSPVTRRVVVPVMVWLTLAFKLPLWLGIVSYGAMMLLFWAEAAILIVGLGCLAGWLLVKLVVKLQSKWGIFSPAGQALLSATTAIGSRTFSFYDLLREYLRSAHDRVCPEIQLTDL